MIQWDIWSRDGEWWQKESVRLGQQDQEGRVERDRRGRGFQQLQTNYDALQCQENVVHGKKIYQSSS